MLIKDIMSTDVICAKPGETIVEVAQTIIQHKISGLPVVNDDHEVIGIVTEGDLLARNKKLHIPSSIQLLGGVIFLENPRIFEEELKRAVAVKVEELMTTEVHSIGPDDTVEEAATLMYEQHFNRLPVVADGKLVGIISRWDIVNYLVRKNQS